MDSWQIFYCSVNRHEAICHLLKTSALRDLQSNLLGHRGVLKLWTCS